MAKVAPMLSYETVKILIRVHLLSGFECIANSLFTNDLIISCNTIAVRLRLKSSRFYENNTATLKTNFREGFLAQPFLQKRLQTRLPRVPDKSKFEI